MKDNQHYMFNFFISKFKVFFSLPPPHVREFSAACTDTLFLDCTEKKPSFIAGDHSV